MADQKPVTQSKPQAAKKKQKWTRFLPLILFAAIIAGIAVSINFMQRTVPNAPDALGNTACNLYNGGFFCSDGEQIYFSNFRDNGALYSMRLAEDGTPGSFKKLHNDMPGYLNATSHYLVYARLNYKRDGGGMSVLDYTNTGLFRINKKDGKGTRMIYSDPVGLAALYGNDIYYQHYDKTDGIDLYHATLDCETNEFVADSTLIPGSIAGGILYYAGVDRDHFIYQMPVGNYNASQVVYQGNCYQPAQIGTSIYFLSLSNDYSIARVDAYGNNPTLLVQERCSSWNVSQDESWVIYQVDNRERNRLECLNLNTLETSVIAEGNYCNIHIVDGFVFYQDFNGVNQYYFPLGQPTDIRAFEPPVLKK